METVVKRIVEKVKPMYVSSIHYLHTILPHVLAVSERARTFASMLKANQLVAEVGGLLHDLGAAKYGREDHHLTGVREALLVLFRCECSLELVGSILHTIYCHRGSEHIPYRTLEDECVAAADTLDHFEHVGELWRIRVRNSLTPILLTEVFRVVSLKLQRSREKIGPRINLVIGGLLDREYDRAMQELSEIASGNREPRGRDGS